MRIAVVTTSYPSHDGDPSGHFVETEAEELEREGHEILVVRPAPGGAFGWPGAAIRIRERPMRAVEAATWMAHAAFELRRIAPDRIIAHWAMPSAFPIVIGPAGLSGPDLEIVSHGGDVRLLCALPARARTQIVRALVRRATRWRFVSDELLTTLASSLPREDAARLRATSEVVPSAITLPDVREDARAKRRAIGTRRLYVCAGRLVASKRVDKVIDYVATSPNHGTTRAERTLVVLGDGPQRAYLERVAHAWGFDVRFLGKTTREEALGWIGAADELVHASHVEGLSTVVREAEALGVTITLLN